MSVPLQFQHQVNLVCQTQCLLGESPVWDEQRQTLHFLDIKAREILSLTPNGLERRVLSTETGSIVLCEGGGLLAAQKTGFAHISYDPFIETDLPIVVKGRNGNRFNDGKCDQMGRFWIASMDDECIYETGSLWSLDSEQSLKQHFGGFVVGNGIGWSLDDKTMYFTDSERRCIDAYEFEKSEGEVGTKRNFTKVDIGNGLPDGLAVDEEGCVWSAQWDGACITRYTPDGIVDMVIEVPVPRPTSLAFGGSDLKTLYITSARFGLSDAFIRAYPMSGGLFSLNLGIRGCLPFKYKGL